MTIMPQQPVRYVPGPYYVQRFSDGCDESLEIRALDADQLITSFCFWAIDDKDQTTAEEIEATARLLASAPELVATLNGLLGEVRRLPAESISLNLAKAIGNAEAVVKQAEWRA
jgi:hypothetical protein